MGEVYLVVGDNKLKGRFMYFADSLFDSLFEKNRQPKGLELWAEHFAPLWYTAPPT